VTFGADGSEVQAVARRLSADFPDSNVLELSPPDAPELVDQSVDPAGLVDSGLFFQLKHASRYDSLNPHDDSIPVWVAGRVRGRTQGNEIFAVVVNGKVVAMTQAYLEDDDLTYVQAIVPPDSLRQGGNNVHIALWNGDHLESVKTLR
jgi:hypothetical protein